MKTQPLITVLSFGLVILSLTHTACKKGSEAVAPNTCETASRLGQDLSAVAQAWINDPTSVSKCQAYKKAATDYVNAADKCTTVSQADVNAAKEAINSLTCQ